MPVRPVKLAAKFALSILLLLIVSLIFPYLSIYLTTGLLIVAVVCLLISLRAIHKLNFFNCLGLRDKFVDYKNIRVFYDQNLNGGGLGLSYEFVRLVQDLSSRKGGGKIESVLEYCAGPGFIGFNLLAHNLCDKVTFCDVNPQALEFIKKSVAYNNLHDRVEIILSSSLENVPKEKQFDLIVSNPPWDLKANQVKSLLLDDPSGVVHQELLKDSTRILKDRGSIILVESHEFTSKNSMTQLTKSNNLSITNYHRPFSLSSTDSVLSNYNSSYSMRFATSLASLALGIYFITICPQPEFGNSLESISLST